MLNWQVLSKELHAGASWKAPTGYPQAKHDAFAPLLAAELSEALPYYPFFFSKIGEHSFRLCVLLSVDNKTNLFINIKQKWMVPYVPAAYRSYPFNITNDVNGNLTVVFDKDSDFFCEIAREGFQQVFSTNGILSDSFQLVIHFMQQRYAQQQQTDKLVAQLTDCGLIEAWPLEIKASGVEEVRNIMGLFRINEKALQSLPASILSELSSSGALSIAYAQLFSQARIKQLITRYGLFNEQINQSPSSNEMDLDKFFDGENGNDVFSF